MSKSVRIAVAAALLLGGLPSLSLRGVHWDSRSCRAASCEPSTGYHNERRLYSNTSFARPSSVFGMVRPRALAVFRLMYSSTLVAC